MCRGLRLTKRDVCVKASMYSVRRLIRSRMIESAAYCNQILFIKRRLIESFGYTYQFYAGSN